MRNLCLLILASIILNSCQIEDKNAPSPNESFIKYYGQLQGYEAKDVEFLADSSGFIIFGNVTGEDGTTDYTILRVDENGTLIDDLVFSFDIPLPFDADGNGQMDDFLAGNDDASQVEVFDGGFAVIGTTSLNNSSLDILDVQVLTVSLYDDNYVNLLDTTLAIPAGDLRDGLDLRGNDIIELSDGGFLIMGSIEIDRGGGVSDLDYFLLKVGTDNADFEEIIGIPGDGNDDILVRGFEKANGNIVLIGYSSDPSSLGENNGDNGLNVNFKELTPDGKILNSVSYGLDNPDPDNSTVFDDVVNDAISSSSGYTITGTTTLATDDKYAFFMNLTNSGLFIDGDTLTSSFGSNLQSEGFGIVQSADNNYIILGSYTSFNITNEIGQQIARAGESMFMKVDQVGVPVAASEANYGTENGNEEAIDALLLDDGQILVLSNTDFGGGIQLISLIKTDDNGQLEN